MKYISGNWLVGKNALIDLSKFCCVRVFEDKIRLFRDSAKRPFSTFNANSEEEAQAVFEEIKNWIPVVGHVFVESISKRSV